jgi:hypothetical protein
VSPTESHAISFDTCIFNVNGVGAYVCGSSTEAVSFRNCYLEQYSDVGIRVGDAASAGSVSAVVNIDNCFFNGNRLVAPTGKVASGIEVNEGYNVKIRGGGYKNHTSAPINVRSNNARVTIEAGNYSTGSGESGSVKLPDASYVTVGRDRPMTIGKVSSSAVSWANATPTASVDNAGGTLTVAGVPYKCWSDGAGGYTWYQQMTGKEEYELLAGTFSLPVVLGAGALEACDGSPTRAAAFTRLVGWTLADGGQNGVSGAFIVPSGWNTVHVDLLWAVTAGSGTVRWVVQVPNVADGDDLTAIPTSDVPEIETPTANLLKVSRATSTARAVTTGNLCAVRVYRDGGHANDTYTGDAVLLGVRITKAS